METVVQARLVLIENPLRSIISATCRHCDEGFNQPDRRAAVLEHTMRNPGHIVWVSEEVDTMMMVGTNVATAAVNLPGADPQEGKTT